MELNASAMTLPSMSRTFWRLCVALCFAFCLGLTFIQPALAEDFEVDTVLDGVDSDLTDGECHNVTVVAGGACTLRAAIQQANFTPNIADTIILTRGTYILTIENPSNSDEDVAETGDLDITTNIVIEGAGARDTIVEAKDGLNDRVFHLVGDDAVAALNRLTVRNGDVSLLDGGTADGGGILVGGGSLNGYELVVANNTAAQFGGGIMVIGVNSMILERCTINGNKAIGSSNSRGGGIFHGQNYQMKIVNCTISDNEANSRGAGVDISNNSNLAIIQNTTIANNRLLEDPEEGGGIYIGNNTDIEIYSSIIANNTAMGGVANDCYGQIDVLDYSLVEAPAPGNDCSIAGDGESVESFLGSVDPLLGELAYNGGDLQTHALFEGSIAVDGGNQLAVGSEDRACYTTDARGQGRPSREYCDMGSYELAEFLYMPKLEKD